MTNENPTKFCFKGELGEPICWPCSCVSTNMSTPKRMSILPGCSKFGGIGDSMLCQRTPKEWFVRWIIAGVELL